MFTSNVDGHYIKAGFPEDRVVECHGSIHYLQALDARRTAALWPAAPQLSLLRVDKATFLADADTLPYCPPESGVAEGQCALARPNILMFGDYGFVPTRTDAQEACHEAWLATLPRRARIVVIEVGAGLAVPSVRHASESILDDFPRATLLRINPAEPQGPGNTVPIPEGGLAALSALDKCVARWHAPRVVASRSARRRREIGGAAGIGSARAAKAEAT